MKDLANAIFDRIKANRPGSRLPELYETHISWILLDGDYAWKIKKPVDLAFVDFSTLDRRRHYCEEEIRLNKRLAPNLYLEVAPITGSPENPEIEGNGEPIDYAVKMRRFDSNQLLKTIASKDELRENHIDQLAETIANFHSEIDIADSDSEFGQANIVWQAVADCIAPIRRQLTGKDQIHQLEQISNELHDQWLRHKDAWTCRREQGFIRECHGDLHLGNITLIDNRVTVFDGIDFNPNLRWIDVMCEVAFMVMDLEHHGLRPFAYRLLNRYLELTGDYEGVKLLPFYVAYRALVRAKVAAIRWNQEYENGDVPDQEQRDMKTLLDIAADYAASRKSSLFITHGMSGSGKTTATQSILEHLAAIRIRSDVERKRLVNDDASSEEKYSELVTNQTYERLADVAETVVQTRFPAIIDATFLKKVRRDEFRRIADRHQIDFVIIDFQAPDELLQSRVADRAEQGNDASDADLSILEMQQRTHEPLENEEHKFVIGFDTTNDQHQELAAFLRRQTL